MEFDDELHPRFDDMYKNLTDEEHQQLPKGESLKMVRERVEPYWNEVIMPKIRSSKKGDSLIFVAHEHVLRGLVQYLSGMDNDAVLQLRLPNAAPFVFEFDINDDFKVSKNYYAEDENKQVSF